MAMGPSSGVWEKKLCACGQSPRRSIQGEFGVDVRVEPAACEGTWAQSHTCNLLKVKNEERLPEAAHEIVAILELVSLQQREYTAAVLAERLTRRKGTPCKEAKAASTDPAWPNLNAIWPAPHRLR